MGRVEARAAAASLWIFTDFYFETWYDVSFGGPAYLTIPLTNFLLFLSMSGKPGISRDVENDVAAASRTRERRRGVSDSIWFYLGKLQLCTRYGPKLFSCTPNVHSWTMSNINKPSIVQLCTWEAQLNNDTIPIGARLFSCAFTCTTEQCSAEIFPSTVQSCRRQKSRFGTVIIFAWFWGVVATNNIAMLKIIRY